MTSCEAKLSAINTLCQSSGDAVCTQILSILAVNNTDDGIDDLWGTDGDTAMQWQVFGIALVLVWICYWVCWFWMAGGMGTELTSQKVGENAGRRV